MQMNYIEEADVLYYSDCTTWKVTEEGIICSCYGLALPYQVRHSVPSLSVILRY